MRNSRERQRSHYFQAIARQFFAQRGAPFFLSSKEIDLIARWEKAGIPLPVVLEGIKRVFEKAKAPKLKRRPIRSLLYCEFEVLAAFEQFKERNVGRKQDDSPLRLKKEKAKAEVKRFIETMPSSLNFLKDIYYQVKDILCEQEIEEEELESLEQQIEELLIENASPEEKEKVRNLIKQEYEFKTDQEFHLMWRIKLTKYLREKYRVPYVCLYYY